MLDFIKPYLHIIEAIAIVALLGWLGYMWHEHNVAQQQIGAAKITAEYKKGYDQAIIDKAAEELRQRTIWANASSDYEKQIYDLRHPAIVEPVHHLVCNKPSADVSAVSSNPAVAGGPRTTDSTGLDRANEFDPGPQLDEYKKDAQALAIQCKAIQDGYVKLTGQTF